MSDFDTPRTTCGSGAVQRAAAYLFKTMLLWLLACSVRSLTAAEITAVEARQIVVNYLAHSAQPFATNLVGRAVGAGQTVLDSDGSALYFCVPLAPTGFILVAPDDRIEPIIAIAQNGVHDARPGHALYALISRDMRHRKFAIARNAVAPRTARLIAGKWLKLRSVTAISTKSKLNSTIVLSSPAVPNFMLSQWNQDVDSSGTPTWNLYTPDNVVCGCVATVMAQTIYYYGWPTTAIGTTSEAISVNGVASTMGLRGGDGLGGPYDYSQMAAIATPSTSTAQRQMMSRLSADVGATVHMAYSAGASGADPQLIPGALTSVFKYTNAIGYSITSPADDVTPIGTAALACAAIQANVTAQRPVLLSIHEQVGNNGSDYHEIIAAGLGFDSTQTPYYYLNFGWDGDENAWYTLPDIGSAGDNFNALDFIVYNLSPTATGGEIVSGIVLDSLGNPAPGATVAMTISGVTSTGVVTNAAGMWAWNGVPANSPVSFTAAYLGLTYPALTVTSGLSASPPVDSSTQSGSIGDLSGLVLQPSGGTAPVPIITSPATANGYVGMAFSYQITAGNIPTSFNATGLPSGLSINTTSGLINGTPTTVATSMVALSASNAAGTTTQNLTITIVQPKPVITSASSASGVVGQAFSFQLTASIAPVTFAVTSLPAGIAVNSASGVISGTPKAVGTSVMLVTVKNSTGSTSIVMTLSVVAAAPVIDSALITSAIVNHVFSYQISATNSPTSYAVANLPSGLTLNPRTGLINGTPTLAGYDSVTISATNGGGTATATLIISIAAGPPVITSALTATAQVGQPFSYQIAGTNFPSIFAATPLPNGLTINTTSGILSGIPTAAGFPVVTISAQNIAGIGTASLTITVLPLPPVITSALALTVTTGSYFSYTILASNTPTSFAASGLPPALMLNSASGVITGYITVNGAVSLGLGATNTGGTGTATLVITALPPIPVITSALALAGQVDVAASYQILASNVPTSFAVLGLPAGLTIDPSSGIISGTPVSPGVTMSTISATNAGGSGTAVLTITCLPGVPAITSALKVSGVSGQLLKYQITASYSPTSYSVSALPGGLLLNTTTGVISGMPLKPGLTCITITATNAGGSGSAVLMIGIAPAGMSFLLWGKPG